MHTGHVHRCAHEEEGPSLLLLTLLREGLDFHIKKKKLLEMISKTRDLPRDQTFRQSGRPRIQVDTRAGMSDTVSK